MDIAIKILAHVVTAVASVALALLIILNGGFIEKPTKIYTIDATTAILGFIQTVDKDMADDAYAAAVIAFQAKLEAEIVALAESQNAIVINSASVLSGGTDITQFVVERVLVK